MRTQQTQPARPPVVAVALHYITSILLIAIFVGVIYVFWPDLVATFQQRNGGGIAPAPLPTAIIPRPILDPAPRPAVVIPGIAQSEAEADRMYQEAIDRANAAPVPNVGQDASAPVIAVELPSSRQPAQHVPTAAPADETGAKETGPPVNIQETRTCKRQQVWTDAGCKNPTPIGAP